MTWLGSRVSHTFCKRVLVKRGHFNNGISLVELLIAMAIFIISIMPVLSIILKERKQVASLEYEMTANILGQNLLQLVRSYKWDHTSPSLGVPTLTPTPIAELGKDPGELVFDDFNDADDFFEYEDNPRVSYKRKVFVRYVTVEPSGLVVSATGPTDFKEVSVRVEYQMSPKPYVITVKTVLKNG